MKALVGAFNQEEALVGAFSVIVKTVCETAAASVATRDILLVQVDSWTVCCHLSPHGGDPVTVYTANTEHSHNISQHIYIIATIYLQHIHNISTT